MEERCSLACSTGLPTQVGTHHNRLGSPISIINSEKIPLQTCLKVSLMEAFFFSVEECCSQMTLTCVKVTKSNLEHPID